MGSAELLLLEERRWCTHRGRCGRRARSRSTSRPRAELAHAGRHRAAGAARTELALESRTTRLAIDAGDQVVLGKDRDAQPRAAVVAAAAIRELGRDLATIADLDQLAVDAGDACVAIAEFEVLAPLEVRPLVATVSAATIAAAPAASPSTRTRSTPSATSASSTPATRTPSATSTRSAGDPRSGRAMAIVHAVVGRSKYALTSFSIVRLCAVSASCTRFSPTDFISTSRNSVKNARTFLVSSSSPFLPHDDGIELRVERGGARDLLRRDHYHARNLRVGVDLREPRA